MSKAKSSEVIENYKGVPIRRCNTVRLKFGIVEFKKIIDEVEKSGLSIHKVLAYSSRPCERCKDSCEIVMIKNGEIVHIKKGILSVPEPNGVNIIRSHENRSQCKKQ